jgi:hypothetical protein
LILRDFVEKGLEVGAFLKKAEDLQRSLEKIESLLLKSRENQEDRILK